MLEGADLGAKLLLLEDGTREGSLGDPELDAEAASPGGAAMWSERRELYEHGGSTLFVDVVAPPPRLIIFGAVDFAAQLAAAAKLAGWRAFVVDPRKRFATAGPLPGGRAGDRRMARQGPGASSRESTGPPRSRCSPTTPSSTTPCCKIALRSEAQYVGAMGSRRAQAKRRERLLAEGLPTTSSGASRPRSASTSAP